MTQMPSESALRWAADEIRGGAEVRNATSLSDGGSSWLLRIDHDGGSSDVVLRVVVPGWIDEQAIVTGAAALRVAEEHGLAAPRLLASDLDGTATGSPLTLETALPGSSTQPPQVSPERVQEAGAAIAKVHGVPFDAQPGLPLRIRPTQVDDHAMERRWATLYQASTDAEKPAVVDALCELTGWPAARAYQAVTGPRSTPLLQLADDQVRGLGRPQGETVFVHGDIWGGNMLWDGDTCLALIDWKTAGAGDPGVDLGQLRMQMALTYGQDTPEHVLQGWQRERGRHATNVPYWDAVAALNTPAELTGWPGFDNQGNPIDAQTVTKRRDDFLRTALDKL